MPVQNVKIDPMRTPRDEQVQSDVRALYGAGDTGNGKPGGVYAGDTQPLVHSASESGHDNGTHSTDDGAELEEVTQGAGSSGSSSGDDAE